MADFSERHVHHIAQHAHRVHRKHEALKAKFKGFTERFVSTLEVGAGAYLGGVLEGRTNDGKVLHVPINLGAGLLALAAAHLDLAGREWSGHLNNLGNGFVASYAGRAGYHFGEKWLHEGFGAAFGRHPMAPPLPAPPPAAAAAGVPDPAQMAAIVAQMQQAAAAHG